MKQMLDLYSGLGGASEAFYLSEDWNTIRVENNPLLKGVPETWFVDVLELGPGSFPYCEFDLIWASPPCREFSQAYAAPGPLAKRLGKDFEPDMTLVEKAAELVEMWSPKWWVIENVIGSIPHFEKIGLRPRQIIGPFVLYGNFPFIALDRELNLRDHKAKNDVWSGDPLRTNYKAKIPLEISRGLLEAIDTQKTLEDYV